MALPAQAGRTYNPSMKIPFIKMHGAGNDFVVLDGRVQSLGLTPGPRPTARGSAPRDRLRPAHQPGTGEPRR